MQYHRTNPDRARLDDLSNTVAVLACRAVYISIFIYLYLACCAVYISIFVYLYLACRAVYISIFIYLYLACRTIYISCKLPDECLDDVPVDCECALSERARSAAHACLVESVSVKCAPARGV